MPTTPRGAPFPTLDDENNPPAHIQALAEWVDSETPSIADARSAAADFLATDPGVAAAAGTAAASAVDGVLDDAGLVYGGEPIDDEHVEEVTFSITDDEGRRSWLEVSPDGGPTNRVVALLATLLGSGASILGGAAFEPIAVDDVSFAITGANDEILLLVDNEGHVSFGSLGPDFIAAIVAALGGSDDGLTATAYRDPTTGDPKPITPGRNVVLVGHSMLAGATAAITAALSPARTVTSLAVGGETQQAIAQRWGAIPATMTFPGGVIPAGADGPTTVTVTYADGTVSTDLFKQGPSSYSVNLVLADGTKVPGTFGKNGDGTAYTFVQAAGAAAVPATRPLPFYYAVADQHRNDVVVFWPCRNGDWTSATAVRDRLDRLQAMVAHAEALELRYVILTEHVSATDSAANATAIRDYNAQIINRYGRHVLDQFNYLIRYGLDDAGLVATAQDTTDIANGVVPTSLRGDGDPLHLNTTYGCPIVATLLEGRLTELEY